MVPHTVPQPLPLWIATHICHCIALSSRDIESVAKEHASSPSSSSCIIRRGLQRVNHDRHLVAANPAQPYLSVDRSKSRRTLLTLTPRDGYLNKVKGDSMPRAVVPLFNYKSQILILIVQSSISKRPIKKATFLWAKQGHTSLSYFLFLV